MGQPIGKRKRPKKPAAKPGPYWLNVCPVCGNVGTVVGIMPAKLHGRTYRWACESCVESRHLFRPDPKLRPRWTGGAPAEGGAS